MNLKFKQKLLILIVLLTLLTLLIINSFLAYTSIKIPKFWPSLDEKLFRTNRDLKFKSILLYTPYGGSYAKWRDYYIHTETTPLQCRNGHFCHLTTNKERIAVSDSILVSLSDLPEHPSMWYPQNYTHASWQKWVVYWNEAPTDKIRFKYQDKYGALDQIFDWSVSYREDSDFQSGYKRCPYKKTNKSVNTSFNREKILKSKDKSALWVVSHCKTASKREEYVESLRTHINVTIKGRCYEDKSKDKDMDAFKTLDNYYFYLSFENSLCDDYITEKFMNMLKHNIVPVVMGAPKRDYERIAPPKSFIHVSDFNSTFHLAQYLTHLQNNPDEYMEYLSWKKEYTPVCPSEQLWICELCHKLYEEAEKELQQNQPIQDFLGLWNQKKCYGNDYSYNSSLEGIENIKY